MLEKYQERLSEVNDRAWLLMSLTRIDTALVHIPLGRLMGMVSQLEDVVSTLRCTLPVLNWVTDRPGSGTCERSDANLENLVESIERECAEQLAYVETVYSPEEISRARDRIKGRKHGEATSD